MFIHLSVALLLLCILCVSFFGETAPTCLKKDEISNLLDWLRDNGAYINEKLEVKQLVAGDSTAHGVFAKEDLGPGETVCKIPWNLILKPKDLQDKLKKDVSKVLDCGTIVAVREAMTSDKMTPYAQYLLAQPKGYTPPFWSEEGKELLMEMLESDREETEQMTEWDELPPHGVDDFFDEELRKVCINIDFDDPMSMHAAMIVKARSDYVFMVPFYDLMNHHNGKYNVRHLYDVYSSPFSHEGYDIVTTKDIRAGNELMNSYNHCNICSDVFDWFGTPEMFLHYGFVESFPQRWLFDFARVKFDLDWSDQSTGEVVPKFLVPPSEKGISLLQHELDRLESFSDTYRGTEDKEEEDNMPDSEWESLWRYYDSMHEALSLAVKSKEARSDEIWSQGDDWWVQEGTLSADDVDEHEVYPSLVKEA